MKNFVKKQSKNFFVMLCILLSLGLQMQKAVAQFQIGDVFIGVANGEVQWRDASGTLIQTLNTGLGGYTTGMAFDAAGNLYVTDFSVNAISVFNNFGVLQGTFGSGYNIPESILFDAAGSAYVGNVGGGLNKYDATGAFLGTSYTGRVDWIDLQADQCTMLFTGEGDNVLQHDVCTNTALPDFANGLGGNAYALRIRKNGDVLVANGINVLRLDPSGVIQQTYDVVGEDSWFALNLDADGTSFYSANFNTSNVYKIDIATGNVLSSFNTGTASSTVFGLAVYGEFTVSRCANNTAPAFVPPTPACGSTLNATSGTPFSFTVAAADINAGDNVILDVSGLPSGATMTPSLPTTGNPVSSVFSWTPTDGDIGMHPVSFTIFDSCELVTCDFIINVTKSNCNMEAYVAVTPKQTVKGQLPYTIYKGYGPQAVKLISMVTGEGENGYKYLWSNGSKEQSRVVSPNKTTRYFVKTTNLVDGHYIIAAVTIYVVDVRCGSTNDKVQVCGGTNENAIGKCVEQDKVAGILKKGGSLGNCQQNSYALFKNSNAAEESMASVKGNSATSVMKVSPNPANNFLDVQLLQVGYKNAKINISDATGQLFISKDITINSSGNQMIDISSLKNGTYLLQVVSSGEITGSAKFVVLK